MDMKELMSYSNNLIEFLKEEKDVVGLKHFVRHSNALQPQCLKDFHEAQKSIQDYEKKIDDCKQKAAQAVTESVADEELDSLQKELEDEQRVERRLKEELRLIINEMDDLDRQRVFVEEERQSVKKWEKDELRAQTKLSMYASVTNIIPYLDDTSKISGHIVDREKKVVEKFEFDPSEVTALDTCNRVWRMLN